MRRFIFWPFDVVLILIVLILTTIGIATIYTITYNNGVGSPATSQAVAAIIGLICYFYFSVSSYRQFYQYRWILYLIIVILLVPLIPMIAPKIPFAVKTFGAYRWYNLKITQFQPSELAKIAVAVIAAGFLADINEIRIGLKNSLKYFLLCLIPVGLIVMEPDLGTAIVVLVITFGLFIAAKPKLIVIIAAIAVIGVSAPIGWSRLATYQKQRIETFINPSSDPLKKGYNVRQALIAIGSGQLTGRGFGEGTQTTLNFLPVAHADFIFAGFSEATGFAGDAVLLILYLVLLYRTSSIALRAEDKFASYLALALSIKLFIHIVINIGMNLALFPVTGVPLPFMSYGGTALIVDFIAVGILQSVYTRSNRSLFG